MEVFFFLVDLSALHGALFLSMLSCVLVCKCVCRTLEIAVWREVLGTIPSHLIFSPFPRITPIISFFHYLLSRPNLKRNDNKECGCFILGKTNFALSTLIHFQAYFHRADWCFLNKAWSIFLVLLPLDILIYSLIHDLTSQISRLLILSCGYEFWLTQTVCKYFIHLTFFVTISWCRILSFNIFQVSILSVYVFE